MGNLLTSENPNGVTTTNTYTPLDQVATTSYSDSTHEVSDTYDANGNRTAMTDASGTSSYAFDPFGELTSSENGAAKTTTYGYDALGDETSVTYPLGSWRHLGCDRYRDLRLRRRRSMTSVSDFNANTSLITNTTDGLPSALSLGSSGDTVSTSYAANDAPSSITLGNGSTLQEFAYSDAPSGAIASETDTPTSSLSPAEYTYDAQSRVTQMTPGSGSAHTYAEDASSNLTRLPTGATGTYDDASELTSSTLSGTTTSYTYDAAGDRTQESVGGSTTLSASYNGAQEVTAYSDVAANTSSATYDGNGLRTAATTTPTGGSPRRSPSCGISPPRFLASSWTRPTPTSTVRAEHRSNRSTFRAARSTTSSPMPSARFAGWSALRGVWSPRPPTTRGEIPRRAAG